MNMHRLIYDYVAQTNDSQKASHMNFSTVSFDFVDGVIFKSAAPLYTVCSKRTNDSLSFVGNLSGRCYVGILVYSVKSDSNHLK